ncbi:beta-glucosidase [Tamlana nanhaiensis]|uniref:Beta-glucosidase n=1 Tax=Neotamlana nanhaiensis TaxID=1382798 RepID=A0A0D7W9C1_9FLAO|nr:glycoside hydrolase family 3 C-terminal domain-containing protein [Tamlana nanhaiensis]KJD34387.1 beta-glucosidase [Tamlana nanhaiensis]
MKPFTLIVKIGLIVLLLHACKNETSNNSNTQTKTETAETFAFEFYNTNLTIDERVTDLISRLTLEEKIDQMMNSTPGIPRLNIPPYDYWNEALHGVGRSCAATVFPQAIALGATFDAELAHRVSTIISDEARALYNAATAKGYHKKYGGLTFWTPNVNIFRDPRWGRGQETYGEDPYLTGLLGEAFVKGLQGDNPDFLKTAACAKHYAVHSGPEKLRHEFNATTSQKDLWETYLPAFEQLVNAEVETIMCAYNSTNGMPCCANTYLINDVLKDKWQFDGHIVTDCGALEDFYNTPSNGGHGIAKSKAEAAAMALKSGINLNCGGIYNHLDEAIIDGLITEKDIDEQLFNLLKTRFKLGLFNPKGSSPYDSISIAVVNSEKHRKLAKEVAQKSIVLLKNNGVLPLKNDLSKYFVTGPNAANVDILLGNYYGVNSNLVTILEGIVNAVDPASQIQYRQGCLLSEFPKNPIDWASGNAGNSDVTIAVLGISSLLEGEEGESLASATAGDRLDYNLPENQLDYLRKLRKVADRNPNNKKPIIAVITGGSPINLKEVHELADAVLFVWYPGEEGGNAVADIIFGKVSPSGRLPITFPESLNQLPAYDDYSMQGRTYRYMNEKPMYPFGFGLSYTNFEYSNVSADKSSINKGETVTLSAKMTNIGNYTSDEVVQVYIKDEAASATTPNFQLIKTKRITLTANTSETLTFTITPKDFEIVLNDGSKTIESGTFKIYIGGSSPMSRSTELGASKLLETQITIQ